MPKITVPQVRKCRKALLGILEHLGSKMEHFEETILKSSDSPVSDEGDDSGSAGTREFQIGLIANGEEIAQEAREALVRIEKKVFGLCVACDSWIPLRRLEALPYARHCVACQELDEKGELVSDD